MALSAEEFRSHFEGVLTEYIRYRLGCDSEIANGVCSVRGVEVHLPDWENIKEWSYQFDVVNGIDREAEVLLHWWRPVSRALGVDLMEGVCDGS